MNISLVLKYASVKRLRRGRAYVSGCICKICDYDLRFAVIVAGWGDKNQLPTLPARNEERY